MSAAWMRQVERQLGELERRLANVARIGVVAEVDPAKGTVRVEIAKDPDGNPVLSDWLPWTERAGAIRTWSPPTIGEQVMVLSPSGESGRGWVSAGGFSDANPAPSDDAGAHVIAIGGTTLTLKDGRVEIHGATMVHVGDVALGGEGGARVARVGDQVHCPAGVGVIVSGSGAVTAL